MRPSFLFLLAIITVTYCSGQTPGTRKVDADLDYCLQQATKTLALNPGYTQEPRDIPNDSTQWHYVGIKDWTSGFWPGIVWYMYEYTKQATWKAQADSFSRALAPIAYRPGYDHDLGFMLYSSLGNGYRLTGDPSYKTILLAAADSLSNLFNPKVGTILSWPYRTKEGWPHHTIIDNMMNLELLFWAAKNGGSQRLYDIAVRHAETTMHNHFRPDYSAYHVVL